MQLLSDKTTTHDNLRQKARDHASPYIQKDQFLDALADQVESDLEDATFDQRPLAYVVAQKERNKIPEDPERKYIRLR